MKRIKEFWDKDSVIVFISAVISMVIAHGFCFMNVMYSHDSLYFYDIMGSNKVELGRWAYPILASVRSAAAPWLMGVLSIIYVSLSVVLVTKLLKFDRVQGICTAVLFSTNVTLTALFCSFIFDADADCLALLLACFAVYAFKNYPKYLNIIIPVIALVLCLALYQPCICVALGLFIVDILNGSKEISDRKGVSRAFITGLKELAVVIAAALIYFPIMKAVAGHFGKALSGDYNGPERLTEMTVGSFFKAIPGAYKYFLKTFLKVTEYNGPIIVVINAMMVILLLICVIAYIKRFRDKGFYGGLAVVIPCLILFPPAVNAIFLVSMGTIHQLMIFAFNIVYLLPLVFGNLAFEKKEGEPSRAGRLVRILPVVAVAIIGINNVIYSNGAYVYKKLVYDNTALHAQTIWKDINNTEGYVEGETPVVFMGNFPDSKVAYHSVLEDKYLGVLVGAEDSAITYNMTPIPYYHVILGRGMITTYNDYAMAQTEEFKSMPCYPSSGYCKMTDGRMIVKISSTLP